MIPAHIIEIVKASLPTGFNGKTKGKSLDLSICALCGYTSLVSELNLDDPDRSNEIKSVNLNQDLNSCPMCNQMYQRYPEIALWVGRIMQFSYAWNKNDNT